MPELPEVETVRRQLQDHLQGKEIAEVSVRSWKSVANDRYFQKKLIGQKIVHLDRKGKYLFVELSRDDSWLMIHLKMTGRLIYQPANTDHLYGGGHNTEKPTKSQPHEHTRVIFTFNDGSHLFFNDMRKFGWVKRVDTSVVEKQKKDLGPEPLTAEYTLETLEAVLSGRNTSVKAALLKQKDIAGLGNIYVDEACWRAGIHPDKEAGTLSARQLQALYDATQSVLADSLSFGGTTFRDFADTGGKYGNFTDQLDVFDREGEDCPRCGETIQKGRVAGRGTHWCSNCQD